MTVFILAAVSLCMLSLTCTSTAVSLLCGGLSGLAIVGAFLVKGPVALFPLVTPLFWFLYSQSRRRRGFTIFGVMLATLGVSALCLLYHAEARDFLQRYFAQQIYASIAGKRELSGSRFRVVYFVGQEILVPVLGGCFLTVVLSRSYKGAWSMLAYRTIEYRRLLYYLGLALAGSLPLLISPKQHRWYIFPALPFYVLATAELFNHVACCLEDLVKRQQRLRQSLVMATLALFSVACLMMWLVHDTPQRDKDFYHDFLAQPLHIDARETISVHPPALSTSWSLVANMQRHFHASLTTAVGYKYLLTTVEHVDSSNTYLSYWKIHPPFPAKYVFLRMDPQQNQEP